MSSWKARLLMVLTTLVMLTTISVVPAMAHIRGTDVCRDDVVDGVVGSVDDCLDDGDLDEAFVVRDPSTGRIAVCGFEEDRRGLDLKCIDPFDTFPF